jgi:hypothetical protein
MTIEKVPVNATDITQALRIHHLPQVPHCRWDSQVQGRVRHRGSCHLAKHANGNLQALVGLETEGV